jgi:hypothetical protein
MTITIQFVQAGFAKHQGRSHPAKVVISTLPALDLCADFRQAIDEALER